ncbi:MAG: cell division protein ZapB [Klebsiella sp.]|uniref:cell division protein ZapB n=1 Tax=Klebsiella sp. TaxID=576 RepID=UPI00290B81A6|nr:cell division protein ZapB [Klebsiella sp.]MDU3360946.1 cell division protein ZapB [Klebsiella sp.]
MTMSLEVFEKLESKVQQAIDTMQEVQSAQHSREELERENGQLKEQQQGWQDRLQALLGRMEEV